jgi:hypothetical protein
MKTYLLIYNKSDNSSALFSKLADGAAAAVLANETGLRKTIFLSAQIYQILICACLQLFFATCR